MCLTKILLESLFNIEVPMAKSSPKCQATGKKYPWSSNSCFSHLVLRKETFDVLHNIYQRETLMTLGFSANILLCSLLAQAFSSVYDTDKLENVPIPL